MKKPRPASKTRRTARKIVRVFRKVVRKRRRLSAAAKPGGHRPAASTAASPWVSAPGLSHPVVDSRLPLRYHENRMVLLVRDPWWLFSYWEVTPERERQVEQQVRDAGLSDFRKVLRVYDVAHSFFDIETGPFADNWHIDAGLPDREWVAEFGLRAGGRFFAFVRSNAVRTPRFGLSDVLDEEWMLPDDVYSKLVGLSGGQGVSSISSMDVRRQLERYLKKLVSSERSSGTFSKSKSP